MSDELALVAPKVVLPPEAVVAPVEQAPLPGLTVEVPPAEQGRAAEAYFSLRQENHLVAGVMVMREKGEPLGIYHVGTMEEVTIADLARRVASAAGREIELVAGPPAAGGRTAQGRANFERGSRAGSQSRPGRGRPGRSHRARAVGWHG